MLIQTFKSRASPSKEKARHLVHVHDWFVLLQLIVHLLEITGSPDILCRNSRAPPENIYSDLEKYNSSRRAEVDMANNRTLLKELTLYLDRVAGPVPDTTWASALEKLGMEIEYLKTELGNLVRKIERLQSEVRWKRLFNLQDQG